MTAAVATRRDWRALLDAASAPMSQGTPFTSVLLVARVLQPARAERRAAVGTWSMYPSTEGYQ
jgi:hypothetical protein